MRKFAIILSYCLLVVGILTVPVLMFKWQHTNEQTVTDNIIVLEYKKYKVDYYIIHAFELNGHTCMIRGGAGVTCIKNEK